MLRSLGGIGRALAIAWPALLAWYLAGQCVRWAAIVIAAPLTADNTLGALLIVPIAVLARLISYIGMFLSLRRAMPGYRTIAGGDVEFASMKDAAAEFMNVLLVTIGPFFTLYALLGLLTEDIRTYGNLALRHSGLDGAVFDASGPMVIVVVLVALALRLALRVFGRRLPGWVGIFEIYLEATWILVALTGLTQVLGSVIQWFNDRQIVFWISSAREWLSSLWEPLRLGFLGIDWLVPVAMQVVLLPLAWLLIAGIIYLRALADVESEALPKGVGRRLQRLLDRLPALLQRNRHIVTGGWEDIGAPIALTVRMTLRSRVFDIALYLAAYAVLYVITQWATRGVYLLIGAHDVGWWFDYSSAVSVAFNAIFEPLRIVVIALAFDFLLQRWQTTRAVTEMEPARTAAADRTPTSP
jgi:hypothetical protein